ncbi:hypothetical protein ACSFA8_24655 [Variovorax sp. RT4R15]|uniref:hypothetical protein n=1 Tax=Variovorax sp. RT4R15 TaxID=3443737 RepID=UPI003F47C87C
MQIVVSSLEDEGFLRSDVADAAAGLNRLGIAEDSQIGSFYLRYNGPLASQNTGFELLDVVGARPQESIEAATALVRSKYGWPERYLVLTSLLGGGVMVYDISTEQVYDVDFEGGDTLLKNGQLEPRYPSFLEFLRFFFGEASATV